MELKSGHKVVHFNEAEGKKLEKYIPGYKEGAAIRLNPGGWFFPKSFLNYADRIFEFEYKPSDVVIMTWPKCGTTWAQEIVWTMMHNVDFKNEAASFPIMWRSPFLELDYICETMAGNTEASENVAQMMSEVFSKGTEEGGGVMLNLLENITPEPRIIKTHLGFSLLNPTMLDTCKVIYVARNAKDACISYLHHHRLMRGFKFRGDLGDFVDLYVNDTLWHSPYWENVIEGWERRNHQNLHWIFYEEMKRNPMNEIKRLNDFLGVDLTQEKLEEILEYTKFESMQKRDPMFSFFDTEEGNIMMRSKYVKENGNFFRKGKSGDWRSHFTDEQNEKLEKWIKEKSSGLGIPFTY